MNNLDVFRVCNNNPNYGLRVIDKRLQVYREHYCKFNP